MPNFEELTQQLGTTVIDVVDQTWTSPLENAAKQVTEQQKSLLRVAGSELQLALAVYGQGRISATLLKTADAYDEKLKGAILELLNAKDYKTTVQKQAIDTAVTSIISARLALAEWSGAFLKFDKEASQPSLPSNFPARLRVHVKDGNGGVAGVKVTLSSTTLSMRRPSGNDGIVDFTSIPAGDYTLQVALENGLELLYAARDNAPTLTFAGGEGKVIDYALVVLCQPTLRVVNESNGAPLEGIVVTLTKDLRATKLAPSGKSGIARLPMGAVGLCAGTYAISVAGTGFLPTLSAPQEIMLNEGDRKLQTININAPKGRLAVCVNRADGEALALRASFSVTPKLGVGVSNGTTISREVDGIKEDCADVDALDPGEYVIEVSNLPQLAINGLKIGPSSDGKRVVVIKPGATTTVRFTLHAYANVSLLGFNIKPGYQKGYRCAVCFKPYRVPTVCCNEDAKGKRCPDCHKLYPTNATHCATCLWGNTNDPRIVFDEQIYLGLDDDRQDLLARCLVMKNAIAKAYTLASTDPTTLKIFMAPEFFFRGIHGTYPIESISMIMDSMRELTKDAKFQDWVFVYGTAIGDLKPGGENYGLKVAADATGTVISVVADKDLATVCGKIPAANYALDAVNQWKVSVANTTSVIRHAAPQQDGSYQLTLADAVQVTANAKLTLIEPPATEIFNVALVQHGGERKVAGLREVIIYKERISPIDFLRDESKLADWNSGNDPGKRIVYLDDSETLVLPTEGAKEALARWTNPDSDEVNETGLGGGSIFTMDGINYALEVCLDHLVGRLEKGYFRAKPSGGPLPQIHLIPSWGAWITLDSLKGNSIVFNVDGPSGSEAGGDASKTVTRNLEKVIAPLAGVAYTVDPAATQNVDYLDTSVSPAKPVTLQGLDPRYDRLFQASGCTINRKATKVFGYGWVVVYDRTPLPAGTCFP